MTIETSFGIITASESALNSWHWNCLWLRKRQEEWMRYTRKRYLEAAITIRNELERNKFYNIKD